MLSPNLIAFYTNWTAKEAQIPTDTLSGVYEKFVTIFVRYNNLYNQIPAELSLRGQQLPKKLFDNKLATEWVVTLLGGKNIFDHLQKEKLQKDTDAVADLIAKEVFHIKLTNGQPQRTEDLKIAANLTTGNDNQRAEALLQIIYYVRCNMFHGHKDFKEYQRLLVEPLSRILGAITTLLFTELSK